MKRTFVSFDVFDTCLIRRCGEPKKIWDLMADKLFNKDDVRGRLSFVGNRSVVEHKLMDENPYPTLRDIYCDLNVSQWGFDIDQIMKLEMDMEEQELFPNPKMLDVVKKYRSENYTICFVSDMYLPSDFLKKILVKFGFCEGCEKVFVSAECNASKNEGSLFDYVFKYSGTKAKQWIHYGDNERSDYLVPKAKGVKSVWVKNTSFTEEEKRWISDARFYTHKHEIELWAGLCRYARVCLDESEATERAVDLVSSLYIPYVLYILEESKKKCVKTLYFLARDAHIFLKIAEQFGERYPDIELKYLKVSRRSLYPCVFYEVNEYEMELTIGQCIAQTAQKAVEYIGIKWDELSKETRDLYRPEYVFTSAKKAKTFAKVMIENDKLLIIDRSKEYRGLLLKYLKQEGLFENHEKACVDLGWIGSCRCILNYLMERENGLPLGTFYWGASSIVIRGQKEDELLVFQKQYDISKYSSGSVLFFEHYASINDAGSTIGYEESNDLIFPVEKKTNSVDSSIMYANENASSYLASFCSELVFDDAAMNEIFLCCGLKQLQRIQDNPSTEDLKFFSFIETESFGRVVKLVQPLLLRNFLSLLIWGIPAVPQWTNAAVKKTFGPFAGLFKKTYEFSSKSLLSRMFRSWWNK